PWVGTLRERRYSRQISRPQAVKRGRRRPRGVRSIFRDRLDADPTFHLWSPSFDPVPETVRWTPPRPSTRPTRPCASRVGASSTRLRPKRSTSTWSDALPAGNRSRSWRRTASWDGPTTLKRVGPSWGWASRKPPGRRPTRAGTPRPPPRQTRPRL